MGFFIGKMNPLQKKNFCAKNTVRTAWWKFYLKNFAYYRRKSRIFVNCERFTKNRIVL